MGFLQDWIFTITSGISPFRVITALSKFTSVSLSCHCLNEFHDEFMDYSFPILANESMDYYFPVQAIFSSFLYSGYPSLLGVMVICHVNNSTYTLILNKIILEAQQYF